MRVYRIEHVERVNDIDGLAPHYVGPFRTSPTRYECGAQAYIDAADASWFHFNRFPTPSAEGLPFEPWMICACKDIYQLRAWFWEAAGLQAMAEMGFVIRSYEVPDIAVHVGEHQCTFDHKAAQPLEVLPLMALAA